jgi:class 3 adenylate cyclase/TolB-like protein/Flp pilus assembly protein TadD
MSADVAGFSRLMGVDEAGTHGRLVASRRVIDALISGHEGRIVGAAGDSVLAEFPSVVEAVRCAVDIQAALRERNDSLPSVERLEFRIGINLGDVIVDGTEIYGDGVNIAARLQAMASPGGIAISAAVHQQVRGKLDLVVRDLGRHRVKNIAEPLHVLAIEPGVQGDTLACQRRLPWPGRRIAAGAGLVLCVLGLGLWAGLSRLPTSVPAPVAPPDAGQAPPGEIATGPPTIAVLPLANRTGDPGQDYLADGLTESIITALGRFSGLRVVGRRLAFSFKGYQGDPRQLGRELRARYLVEGSIRRSGDGGRLSIELTDAESGVLLWSEELDAGSRDLPAMQQAILQRIVGALAVKLSRTEQARIASQPTDSLEAYDLVLRARHLIARRTRSANNEARSLLQRAIALDPSYPGAHLALAEAHLDAASWGWREPGRELAAARELALKAVELDPGEARAHQLLSTTYSAEGQWDLAEREVERALALNPSDPEVQWERGAVALRRGRMSEAIQHLEAALDADPGLDPLWQDLGLAYWLAGRPQDAIAILRRGLVRRTDRPLAHAALAGIYAELGELPQAEAEANAVRRLEPFFAVANMRTFFADPALGERVVAALRKAGLS